MSHNLSAIRSSRASRHYSPYSHTPLSGHDAAENPPGDSLHPLSAQYLSTQSATSSTTGCPPMPPSSDLPPLASTSQHITHHSESPVYQSDSSVKLANPVTSQLDQSQAPERFHSSRAPQTRIYQGQGMFSGSHHFSLPGDNTFIDNSITLDNFMKDFLQHTIIGAEFDSSDRDPPPRCHPGTRLAILQRCLDFIVECSGERKLRWVVGPAGVGKSAVMQIVTEKAPEGVIFTSVFLSVNGRQDGTKTIVTIAYQLAVKCGSYRQFIRDEISLDPSLLRKSLSVQFRKFIVEPFMLRRLFDTTRRFLIAIDGLDECDNPLMQQHILELISDFCITYPTSPIAWIVASRPEPHITSFFERDEVQPAYTKEEIEIDSDEACEDAQRYLRAELNKIKRAYPSLRHKREWPSEHEFTKIATAAGGLFAYASTVAQYIGDPYYRDPATQLRHVLEVISASPRYGNLERDHPMAQLDALYTRILSNIPDDVMINIRKLLLLNSIDLWASRRFREQCNILGLTEDAAYGATNHLHAVAKIPDPNHSDEGLFEYFHKSFRDFLSDFERSAFSENILAEARELMVPAVLGIVEEVPLDTGGFAGGEDYGAGSMGMLKGGPGLCDNISLSWPGDAALQQNDDELRRDLYCNSMRHIGYHFGHDYNRNGSMLRFRALTTRFNGFDMSFPAVVLREAVFGKFRHELSKLGELKQVSLRRLNYAAIYGEIEIRFMGPIGTNEELSDRWYPSCKHEKEGFQQCRGWLTQFGRYIPSPEDVDVLPSSVFAVREHHEGLFTTQYSSGERECNYCLQRFSRHFFGDQDRLATIFIDSTKLCYVEFSFIDPDDRVSEWTYRFFHSGRPTSINHSS